MADFHVTFRDLLHAVNLRHGTNGFTSLLKEGVLRIFSPWKIPTDLAGFEPANLDTKGQHATSRPPKPLKYEGNSLDGCRSSSSVSLRTRIGVINLSDNSHHSRRFVARGSAEYAAILISVSWYLRNYRFSSSHWNKRRNNHSSCFADTCHVQETRCYLRV